MEVRWADGRPDRIAEIAAEFIRLKADVIVTTGTSVPVVMRATPTIPIVFAIANDPIPAGLVASLARPGGAAARQRRRRYRHLTLGAVRGGALLPTGRGDGHGGTRLTLAAVPWGATPTLAASRGFGLGSGTGSAIFDVAGLAEVEPS